MLAAILPPAALIPVHGVVQFGSNAGRAALMRAQVHGQALPWFLAGSAAGALAGGATLTALPPATVEIAVGCFILWSVYGRMPSWGVGAAAPAGAISSVLTMAFGATGPFVMAWVRGLGLERQGVVATHAALMTGQHGLKCVAFGLFGFAFGPWLGLCAAMVAAGFLGTVAGRKVLLRRSEAAFRRVLDIVLTLLAARLLWSGAASFFA